MHKKIPSKPIPENQYFRFKDRLDEFSKENQSDRNVVLFQLCIATGYRVQDISDLTIGEIREALNNGYFLIQEKKQYNSWETIIKNNPDSNKKKPNKRKHDIEPQLDSILKRYIKSKKKSEYAFPSQKNKGETPITPKSYSAILSNVAKSLNLKNISGHSLRKTYAWRLWKATKNLEYVRIALGHKSIEVTKRYLGLDEELKSEAAKIAAKKL